MKPRHVSDDKPYEQYRGTCKENHSYLETNFLYQSRETRKNTTAIMQLKYFVELKTTWTKDQP